MTSNPRREPKFNKRYRTALLLDAMGGGLCPKHGEYFGHGRYNLRDCPFCDIEEHYKNEDGNSSKLSCATCNWPLPETCRICKAGQKENENKEL